MASNRPKTITREHLARTIHETLDLPPDAHGDPSDGIAIVHAILNSMRDALRRGEDITIKGFGTFTIVHGKPRRTGSNFITQQGTRSPVPITHRPKSYVVFKPSEQVLAMLNLGTNWDEKRAMEIWNK